MTAIPPEQLRQLVKEVLADVTSRLPPLPRTTNVPFGGAVAPPECTLGDPQAGQWTVRIRTDEDLHAFVLRVLKVAGNPKLRQDLISGRARFRLAGAAAAAPAPVAHHVEKGAVTERTVAAAAAAGARLVLGPRAVLTPLARDKARALGVAIERPRGGRSDARAPGSTDKER